jgi:transcriptional regulator with XRE-family HTH domain
MTKTASDQIQQAVGMAIKNRRAAVGMSQETLAAAVGLSRSSIANIECGRQKIGVTLLYVLAELLQTTPHDLLPPPQSKTAVNSGDIPLPKDLPAEDKDWIRTVLNPSQKQIRKRA